MIETRDAIAQLLAEGTNPSEIARRLKLARPTVEYHVSKLQEQVSDGESAGQESAPGRACSLVATREAVRDLLADGRSRAEIADLLGVSRSTVSYHARRLGAGVDERCARRYDWAAIQRYYDAGNSVRECKRVFGFSLQSWHAARLRGEVATRGAGAMPIGELLVMDRHRSRQNIKRRLLAEGIKAPACESCDAESWLGRPIPLDLHHVNGVRDDNRLENLQLVCPNCHALIEGEASGRLARA